MAISLTNRFIRELEKGVNSPNVVVELDLDGGTIRFGYHGGTRRPQSDSWLAASIWQTERVRSRKRRAPGVVRPQGGIIPSEQARPQGRVLDEGQLTAIISEKLHAHGFG
ncbi:MAG: hypothetical protein HS130_12525 [Deltaproteobacteria bacterium]|nr:hypothetical protein [Deltaproteobacteria bacterium]